MTSAMGTYLLHIFLRPAHPLVGQTTMSFSYSHDTDKNSSYLTFCTNSVIPSKQVSLYPNNKPWVTKYLKICLNKKKLAFLSGDRQKVFELEKEFIQKSRLAKIHYKNKGERKFTTGNVREAWQGLNTMMGREQRPAHIKCTDPTSFAEQLNTFYSRFDNSQHPLGDKTPSTPSPSYTSVTIEKNKVVHFLSRVNPQKSSGPDKLHGRVLKETGPTPVCL